MSKSSAQAFRERKDVSTVLTMLKFIVYLSHFIIYNVFVTLLFTQKYLH